MNFFTVGYILTLLNFNAGWFSLYVIKTVGMLFMIAGMAEIRPFIDLDKPEVDKLDLNKIKQFGLCTTILSVVCSAVIGAAVLLKVSDFINNIIVIVCSAVSILMIMFFMDKIIKLISTLARKTYFVNDNSNVVRLADGWKKVFIFTSAGLAGDVLCRIFTNTIIADVGGVIALIARILMLIYLVSSAVTFNKVRMDFNKVHADDLGLSDK